MCFLWWSAVRISRAAASLCLILAQSGARTLWKRVCVCVCDCLKVANASACFKKGLCPWRHTSYTTHLVCSSKGSHGIRKKPITQMACEHRATKTLYIRHQSRADRGKTGTGLPSGARPDFRITGTILAPRYPICPGSDPQPDYPRSCFFRKKEMSENNK